MKTHPASQFTVCIQVAREEENSPESTATKAAGKISSRSDMNRLRKI
jgi:hypothetical protein